MMIEQTAEGWTLPRSWRVVPLSEAVDEIDYGLSAPIPKEPPSNGVRIVSTADITKAGGILYDQIREVSAPPKTIARLTLRDGDVLFNWRNSAELVGKTGVFTGQPKPHIFASFILRIRCGETKTHNLFLAHLMNYYRYAEVFLHLARRAVNQANYNRNEISVLKIPLPPYEEQRKIAQLLGHVQRALDQQKRQIELTSELKKAVLQQLFTKGLRHELQKQTDVGPVPQSWEIVTLGSLAKIGNGSTPKRDNEGYWQGGTIPWLNSAKIHERFITEADQFVTDLAVKECHLPRVKPGSLLVAITGQGKTLGNTALLSFESCINQHLAYAQFTTSKVVPDFIFWFMQTRYDHLRSISQAGGSTKGALTCGYLKTYPVPIPALDEQREIADVFAALDRKEKVHLRKHAALTALFRTLLHRLMTGRLRVQDLDLSHLGAIKE